MSRLYPGLYSVLMVWYEAGIKTFGHWGPDTHEECQKFLLLIGLGVPFEGHRVERAIIVGPVAGSLA